MATIEKGSMYLLVSRIIFFLTGYLLYLALGRFLLTPEQFGVFGVVIGLVSITNVVLVRGIRQSVSKFVSAQREIAETVRAKAFQLQLGLSSIIFVAYVIAAPFLAAMFNDPSLTILIQISAVSVFFQPLFNVLRGYINGLKKFKEEAVLSIIARTLRLVLPIALALAGFSLVGVFGGIALAAALALAVAILIAGFPRIKPGQVFASKTLLVFALPVIAFSFLQSLMMQLDVFFVKALVAEGAQAGYYVAAVTLGKLPFEVVLTITLVLFPLVSETTFSQMIEKAKFYVMHSFRYALMFIVPAALIASVTAPQLISLFYGAKYGVGAEALSILLIAYIFFALFSIASTIIVASGHPKRMFLLGAAILLLDFALNSYLVPLFGIKGAAISSLVAMALAALVSLGFVFHRFRVFPLRSALKIFIAAGVAMVPAILFPLSGGMLIVEYIVLMGVYAVLLFLLREIKPVDINVVKNALF
ncbi:MAG: hypothetical protein CL943_00615 [Candidatus Diapherotrites archaeon]|uniref:Uncharacterized protein n=1 Tax=Candidatus Iainarchaeum sp. TaxID=3101447 RepID=A0A2D6M046_9ARCH|nr:hypothetical protein [Candidatus Diapherotrites archaeon]|tara:strand:- start:1573 stop:2997 length:1425 start_codon:yes stop_codon:yes gene_type:complete